MQETHQFKTPSTAVAMPERMNTTPPVELAILSESSDYKVRAHDTDPRGWIVTDANGVTLGTVTDLVIDVEGLLARYIVCGLQRSAEPTNVLLPMGFVRLNNENKIVHLDFITTEAARRLPPFTGLPLSAEKLAEIETVLTGAEPATAPPSQIIRRSDAARDAS
jgi:hypothetical protein